jgi:hypothetical protein
MKTTFPLTLRICAASALLTVSALAQAPAPSTAQPTAPAEKPKPLSVTDKKFVKDTGQSLYYQIQLANAAKNAITDENLIRVRDGMIRDLNKAFEGLSKIAVAHGETLATELTGSDKSGVERLGKLKEDKFTKQWLEDLMKEAKRLDRNVEAAAKTVQDADLKTYITNYGPTVHVTLTAAEGAEKGLKKK